MNICGDDEGLDETEDDTGLLRIGNLILCSREEWLRRRLERIGPRLLASKLAVLDPRPRSSGAGAS